MKKIKIKKNTLGDSRTAERIPTISEFCEANVFHGNDVEKMMRGFAEDLITVSRKHDWSKVKEPYESMFYRELCDTIEGRMNFVDGEWYKNHCSLERHHLLENCPDDVTLIDVIEMICDCVCAGMARSGEVRALEINPEILNRAVANTVQMLKDSVEVVD